MEGKKKKEIKKLLLQQMLRCKLSGRGFHVLIRISVEYFIYKGNPRTLFRSILARQL